MDPNAHPVAQPIQQDSSVQPNNQVQQTTNSVVQGQQTVPVQAPVLQPVSQDTLLTQPVQGIVTQPLVAAQPVQQNPVLPQQNIQPPVSVHIGKEAAPLVVTTGNEYATNPDVILHQEVVDAGVELTPPAENVITQEVQDVGLEPVKTAQAVPTEPKLKLPLPEDKVESILKAPRKNPMNSLLWLATLLKKILKKENQKGDTNGSVVA